MRWRMPVRSHGVLRRRRSCTRPREKEMFDPYLRQRAESAGEPFLAIDAAAD